MLQALLSGLAIGAIYGLVAMGFAIAFYVTRVINFAQGQFLMVAIMVTAAVWTAGWPVVAAIVVGIVCACLAGVLTYVLAVRPVLAFSRFSFAWLVSTLGVALILENGAALIWGPASRAFPSLLNGTSIPVGSAVLTGQEVLAIAVALAFAVDFELVRTRTLFGKLAVAIAFDPEMAEAVGANTTAFAIIAFAVAGLFAGVAGALIGPRTFANPYLGETYGIAGFVALMIGGTERPVAAMLGGFVLGILSQGANALINSQASDWFPFVVLVAVLLVSPEGLFGSANPVRRLVARGVRGALGLSG